MSVANRGQVRLGTKPTITRTPTDQKALPKELETETEARYSQRGEEDGRVDVGGVLWRQVVHEGVDLRQDDLAVLLVLLRHFLQQEKHEQPRGFQTDAHSLFISEA